jgi:hypothetical protein
MNPETERLWQIIFCAAILLEIVLEHFGKASIASLAASQCILLLWLIRSRPNEK